MRRELFLIYFACITGTNNIIEMKSLLKLIVCATLSLLVATPVSAQGEKTIRRKVAIGRFSNET